MCVGVPPESQLAVMLVPLMHNHFLSKYVVWGLPYNSVLVCSRLLYVSPIILVPVTISLTCIRCCTVFLAICQMFCISNCGFLLNKLETELLCIYHEENFQLHKYVYGESSGFPKVFGVGGQSVEA